VEVPETQYHRPVPLIGNLNPGRNSDGDHKGDRANRERAGIIRSFVPGVSQRGSNA
jgi:hypothetical protein